MITRILLSLSILATSGLAQDGGQLFALYCSACHGADGAGATGGAFPPLAESPWVGGDPDRAVKIVLHGLHGPVNVAGKTYNLEMPPQGTMLADDQIAAILTYVRSSWGNQAGPVTADLVKSIRTANSGRDKTWTAGELLKLHPLPFEKTALRDLISKTYQGTWKAVPDFTSLTPSSVEEEHNGIISVKDSAGKDNFAMTWEGQFEAPVSGTYEFVLDADDSAKLVIGGKLVTEVRGIGPMTGSRKKQAKIKLQKGAHPFRVEYLELAGQEGVVVGWMAPGMRNWQWLTEPANTSPYTTQPIPIAPAGKRPAIYRNFITGTTARAIGFGFPGGVNLAYSADHLATELLWTGNFMDGSLHWIDRGIGNQPPAGDQVIRLGNSRVLPAEARFRGYKLDASGNPTFTVELGDQKLLDSWRAESSTLIRTLTLIGPGTDLALPIGNTQGNFVIEPETQGSVTLSPSKPATFTYRWK